MIVISEKFGQLGNRLFLFAQFVANSIECGYRVWNPAFEDYAHEFEEMKDAGFVTYPPNSWDTLGKRCRSLAWRAITSTASCPLKLPMFDVASYLDSENRTVDLQSATFQSVRKRHAVLQVKGWEFRDPGSLRVHAEKVRRFFEPRTDTRIAAQTLCDRLREHADVLVGLHVRRGDYADFAGGRHFHSFEQYEALMVRLAALFHPKKVCFAICSNDSAAGCLTERVGLQASLGPGTTVADLLTLAFSDYIVGPPSTFSVWASYWGNTPLLMLMDIDQSVTLDQFVIYGMNAAVGD